MMRILIVLVACACLVSCHSKKKEKKDKPFPVVSFLKGQVKEMDTASHHFTKIEIADGHSDTVAVTSADFKKYAKDFTELPDISSDRKKDDYDQSNTYDDYMRKSILTYTAQEPDDEIRRESVILGTNEKAEGNVETIVISRVQTENDATVEKEMTWHVNRRFQVVTKTTKPGQPEQIRTLIISWE